MVLLLTGDGSFVLGSEISSEPMYIIMNTAISSQWGKSSRYMHSICARSTPAHLRMQLLLNESGFPGKCPANCPCKTYDCKSDEWQSHCGFSDGFCDMVKNTTNKPEYRINWVRVYQDPNDEQQKVGCSTPERPTRKYIEAHESNYKQQGDVSEMSSLRTRIYLTRVFSILIDFSSLNRPIS